MARLRLRRLRPGFPAALLLLVAGSGVSGDQKLSANCPAATDKVLGSFSVKDASGKSVLLEPLVQDRVVLLVNVASF